MCSWVYNTCYSIPVYSFPIHSSRIMLTKGENATTKVPSHHQSLQSFIKRLSTPPLLPRKFLFYCIDICTCPQILTPSPPAAYALNNFGCCALFMQKSYQRLLTALSKCSYNMYSCSRSQWSCTALPPSQSHISMPHIKRGRGKAVV